MVKNSASRCWLLAAGLAACRTPDVTEGRYQGMAEHDERALAFEVAGRISAVTVQRGQRVRAGEILARQDEVLDRAGREVDAAAVAVAEADLALVKAGSRIEDIRAAEAQLTAARATERNAETEAARQRTLVAREAAPRAELDSREAQLAAATGTRQAEEQRLRALRNGSRAEDIARAAARVAQAIDALALDERRIEKRVLVAPSDGVVQDVYLEPGEIAGAGVPVLVIADVAHPYADVFVPIAEAPRVAVGDRAQLQLEGLDGELAGTVELVYAEAEATPRFVFSPRERANLVLRTRVRIDDPGARVHAGLPVYARFAAGPQVRR